MRKREEGARPDVSDAAGRRQGRLPPRRGPPREVTQTIPGAIPSPMLDRRARSAAVHRTLCRLDSLPAPRRQIPRPAVSPGRPVPSAGPRDRSDAPDYCPYRPYRLYRRAAKVTVFISRTKVTGSGGNRRIGPLSARSSCRILPSIGSVLAGLSRRGHYAIRPLPGNCARVIRRGLHRPRGRDYNPRPATPARRERIARD